MPWKTEGVARQRRRFVEAVVARRLGLTAVCWEFKISRTCGYKWWRRFKESGGRGLTDRRRKPHGAERLKRCWMAKVVRLRRQYGWGARKIHALLPRSCAGHARPSVRTITRWLQAIGAIRRRPRRPSRRVVRRQLQRRQARAANDVWTVDFKGSFLLRDGTRVHALTVRDLASRCVLCVQVVRPDERDVARVLRRLFKRYGVPREIWTDNGPPFGSNGPRGWSALSLGWVKLGIHVAFGRPACPGDNAAHEQMHRVLKAEATRPPSANAAAQQCRFNRWRRRYNHIRPHESLQMQTPARRYRVRDPRPLVVVPPWKYPARYRPVRLDSHGRYNWAGKQRWIGRAFAFEYVGLRTIDAESHEVYFGRHLLGTVHRDDSGYLRPI